MATPNMPTGCQTAGGGKILAATSMQPLRIWDSLLNSLCPAQVEQVDMAPKQTSTRPSNASSYTFIGG